MTTTAATATAMAAATTEAVQASRRQGWRRIPPRRTGALNHANSKKVTLVPEGGHALSGDGIGSSGDADSGSDPPLCSDGSDNSGDADPGSDPPPCSEDGGNSGDADSGSDPPPRSDDSGNSGDADPGSDPPPCSEDGSDSDDTGHEHSIGLTCTGKDPPLSFGLSLPLSPPLLTPAAKCAGA